MNDRNQDDQRKPWRKAKRLELLQARQAVPSAIHRSVSNLIVEELTQKFLSRLKGVTALYSPVGGEPDILPFAERLLDAGGTLALPVVIAPGQSLQFRKWEPGNAMMHGVYGIAYPAIEKVVQPDALIVPVLGFDAACYRLGHGGGYYDRTLGALSPKPLTIGVGMEQARLPTIYPQLYDVPMDFIVTEAGVTERC